MHTHTHTHIHIYMTQVPFHKLSQWLTYSLLEPFMETLHLTFDGLELLTGLAEYRNGGLFVDFGSVKKGGGGGGR